MQETPAAHGALTLRVLVALVSLAAPAAAGPGVVEVARHEVPGELEAGVRVTVPVELLNHGGQAWDPDSGYALSYHWLDGAGAVIVWDGARTALPQPLAPGDSLRLDAVLEVPLREGRHLLQWDMVQDGVRWLAEIDPSPPLPIPVTIRAGYAFSVVRGRAPRWLRAGCEATRRLRVRNEGSVSWPAGDRFAVSFHWLDASGDPVVWDGARTPLPQAVEPGGELPLEVRLRAPQRLGSYRLQWDMVHEGVAWFSERDPSPEPLHTVMVVTSPFSSPPLWAAASLAAALLVVVIVRRGGGGWPLGLAGVADVVWCGGALLVKQQVVLDRAGQPGDGRTLLLAAAGAAVVLLPLLLLQRRLRAWCCVALAGIATALLYADLLYQRFFGDLLSLALAGAAHQVGDVRASVASLFEPGDIWFWIDLLAGAAIAAALPRLPGRTGRAATAAVAAGLAAALVAGGVAAAALVRGGGARFDQVFQNLALAREVGVVNFHAVDGARSLARRLWRPALEPADLDRAVAWFAERAPRRAGVGPWFGAATGANLLMVQAESLQGFVLGLEVDGQEVTPFLNRWAEGALLFGNATDQTAQGRSSDAELLTQVSLLPPPAGAAAFRFAGNHFTGLASALADRGHDTVSAVAFDGAFWNRRLTLRAYGFAENLFEDAFVEGEVLGWGLNDRDFFRQMAGRLAAGPQPSCALLLTLGLHHPFEGFPERLEELSLGELEGSPIGNYLHTMRFFDRAFAALIGELEASGLAERTVVVVWGDHDAGLEWTPRLAAMAGQRHDAAGWYSSQRVPLLIRAPGVAGLAGVLDLPAGHQDVAPTVLALLGVDPAPYPFIGRNLLGSPGNDPVVGEYGCWQDGSRLYLQGGGRLEDGDCFELPGLRELEPAACAAGFAEARRQAEVSALVLEHDLQQEIRERLLGAAGSGW
ncbi:MAG TPA: sulfatase-like hydrolase/transferase [Thermoanaerobaculales bacterium]|nr:sulfatase-like hydrolase/transferase [Thermoanaerobaculales bacterium]HQL31090.1 sulfatase-like hydrolase/transferase [Thermoanaerobaculales bacterium]